MTDAKRYGGFSAIPYAEKPKKEVSVEPVEKEETEQSKPKTKKGKKNE